MTTVKYSVEVEDSGDTFWFNKDGKLHRDGGLPAIEYASGYKAWWVKGKLHREGGLPAIEYPDGSKEWWVNGKRHRDGGLPAREWSNDSKEWLVNGKLHRDGGLPAIEWADGTKVWWVNGNLVTEEEAKRLAGIPCNPENSTVEINGKRYRLIPT